VSKMSNTALCLS